MSVSCVDVDGDLVALIQSHIVGVGDEDADVHQK